MNKKISALGSLGGTPAVGDIIPITDVSDTTGSAQGTTKKVTVANLVAAAPVQSVAGRTGTVTLSNTDVSGLGDAATKTVGTANTNVLAVSSGVVDLGGNKLEGFDASIDADKTANHTLVASDNGKVIVMNKASAVTVTVPSGLGAGFNCSFVQKGAGRVTFSASGTTINNRQSHTKINAQYGVASLLAYADDTFVLAGDTAS